MVLSTSRQCKSRSLARKQVSWASRAAGCVLSLSAPSRASQTELARDSRLLRLACRATAPAMHSLLGSVVCGIIHNARRARHAATSPCLHLLLICPSRSLSVRHSVCRSQTPARRETLRHSDTRTPPTSHLLPLPRLLQDPSIVSPPDSATHDSPLDVPPTASSL